MNAFFIALTVFLLISLLDWWIKRRVKIHTPNEQLIDCKLNEYLDKYKEAYQLNDIEIFRLKVLTLFSKLDNEEEKEKIRRDLKGIIKENNGKAHIIFGYRFFGILIRVLSSIGLLFFVYSPNNMCLALFVNGLISTGMILNRRWILAFLFGVFGLILYPRLPSHFLVFIGLNSAVTIYKSLCRLYKKKVLSNESI